MRGTLLVALALASALTALAHLADRPEDSWSRIRRQGVVRVGYAPERPFSFRTPDGRVTGESPEIARVVFERLGVPRVELVQTEFRALIPQLQEGRFDVIAAGMFVTPERAREVTFSHPTFVTRPALLVRAGTGSRWCGLSAFREGRLPRGRLAVLESSVEEHAALATGVHRGALLPVPDITNGVAAVRSGAAQALALSHLALRDEATRTPDLQLVFPTCDDEVVARVGGGAGAFAFRKGDAALAGAFDAELRRFVGTAGHRALVAPFGLTPQDLPPAGGAR